MAEDNVPMGCLYCCAPLNPKTRVKVIIKDYMESYTRSYYYVCPECRPRLIKNIIEERNNKDGEASFD